MKRLKELEAENARHACRILGQRRSTQRRAARMASDEAALTSDIIKLARRYALYRSRRIMVPPRDAGGAVKNKRVAKIWRRQGVKVSQRQPRRL